MYKSRGREIVKVVRTGYMVRQGEAVYGYREKSAEAVMVVKALLDVRRRVVVQKVCGLVV